MSKSVQLGIKPFLSGFCSPSNPPDSHARCDYAYVQGDTTHVCRCQHHEENHMPKTDAVLDWRDKLDTPDPGFYDDIPEPAYHSSRTSLSYSGAKVIIGSPAVFRHQLTHPVIKHEFDEGTAAHEIVLGCGEGIAVLDFPDRRTNAYRDAEKAARDAGKTPILRKQMDVVEAMAERIQSHRQAMELLADGKPEVSAYALDEDTGVMRRSRFDWLGDVVLTDYKTTVAGGAHPDAFGRTVIQLRYYMQHPWYLDLARDLGHSVEAFAFIVQEKVAPYEVTVIELPPEAVKLGREKNRVALQRFRDCMDTDLWPSYVPDDQIAVANIPNYAYYDDEVETS